MMVPDYALISEILLFSYGFEIARSIVTKVTASLKLSSEQLSRRTTTVSVCVQSKRF